MKTVWILILTLNGLGSTSPNMGAIDHLPPFSSEDECKAAGAKWKKDVSLGYGGSFAISTCVKQSSSDPDLNVSMYIPRNPAF